MHSNLDKPRYGTTHPVNAQFSSWGIVFIINATIWTVVLILQLHTFLRVYCIDNVKIVKIGNFVSYFMFNILKSYVIMDLKHLNL